MREIPKDIIDDVNSVVNELLVYKNDKDLSWMSSYKEVLKKINMNDRNEDNILLMYVVTRLTELGYDIQINPFKLKKFR